jgi:hypothetical protein
MEINLWIKFSIKTIDFSLCHLAEIHHLMSSQQSVEVSRFSGGVHHILMRESKDGVDCRH